MTRIKILKREEMNDEQGRVFDAAEAAGNPTGGPYWAYIRTPGLMQVSQDMSSHLRNGPLSGRERQIAVLTVVRYFGAEFPWFAQARASVNAGVDQSIIDAINRGETPDLSDERERLAYQCAKELMENKSLSDATYAAAEKAYSLEELIYLVAAIGQFGMVCTTANAFDLSAPDGDQKLL